MVNLGTDIKRVGKNDELYGLSLYKRECPMCIRKRRKPVSLIEVGSQRCIKCNREGLNSTLTQTTLDVVRERRRKIRAEMEQEARQ